MSRGSAVSRKSASDRLSNALSSRKSSLTNVHKPPRASSGRASDCERPSLNTTLLPSTPSNVARVAARGLL